MHNSSTLTIFVSSPHDAVEERRCARNVIERLSGQAIAGRRYEIEPLMWETATPAVLGKNPQEALEEYVGKAGDADIYVGIFRHRIGSPTVVEGCRYESGTLREFRDANSSRMITGRPTMLLYRSKRGLAEHESQERQQIQSVETFFDRALVCDGDLLSFDGLAREVDDLASFAESLERDLRGVIAKMASDDRTPLMDLIEGVKEFLQNFEQVSLNEGIPVLPIRRQYQQTFSADASASPSPQPQIGPNDALIDVFDNSGWSMLIVGEQGSGKTFEMWRLMQLLLHRARNARPGDAHVPVYFNLASWAATYERNRNAGNEPLDSWFVDELVRRYAVSRRVARDLVGDRQIVFCLDGLDELVARDLPAFDVDAQDARDSHPATLRLRSACVRAIDQTIRRRPAPRMVLCCRADVYSTLEVRPGLNVAICLTPLDETQAMSEMSRWVGLDALRAALDESSFLRGQARNPLHLRLMQVAYRSDESHLIKNEKNLEQNRKWQILINAEKQRILNDAGVAANGANGSAASWVQTVVAKYVEKSIPARPQESKRRTRRYYNKTTALRCLSWMAVNLPKDFLVEDFQPSLLRKKASINRYRWISAGLLTIVLVFCGAIPPAIGTVIEWQQQHSHVQALTQGLTMAMIIGSVVIIFGLPAFLASHWLTFGLCLGLGFGISRGSVVALSAPDAATGHGIQNGMKAAALTCACATVVFSLFGLHILPRQRESGPGPHARRLEIVPLENWNWTWYDRSTQRGGWVGLLVGPLIGSSFLFTGFGPARAIAFGIIVTMVVVLFAGLGGTAIRISLRPNQGIERSLKHATRMACLLTLVAALASGVSYGVVFGATQGVVNAVQSLVLLFSFLMFGGIPVIRHSCLGHELHRQCATPTWWCVPPWRATIAFLDDMVRCQILRRSAGGYAFRHSVLREHFRSMRGPHERRCD